MSVRSMAYVTSDPPADPRTAGGMPGPRRVPERRAVVGEERGHVLGALHPQLGVVDHLQAVLRVDGLAALDADHDVLRLGVLGMDVVEVVRGDQRGLRAPWGLP